MGTRAVARPAPGRPSTRQQTPSVTHGQMHEPPRSSTNHYRYSAPQPDTHLGPVRAPVNLKRNHYSTPTALNMIKDDLSNKLPNQTRGAGGGGVTHAWHSNPSSRNPSRNPSRQSSSRNPRPNPAHTRTSSCDMNESEDDLVFHDVRSNTLPRSNKKATFSISDSNESIASTLSHLPSINETPSVQGWKRKNCTWPEKTNGFNPSNTVEIRTEMDVVEVLTEIMRAAHSLKISEVDKNGPSSVVCTWGRVKMLVSVSKERFNCKLHFQWLSGGDAVSYREKFDKLSRKIKL